MRNYRYLNFNCLIPLNISVNLLTSSVYFYYKTAFLLPKRTYHCRCTAGRRGPCFGALARRVPHVFPCLLPLHLVRDRPDVPWSEFRPLRPLFWCSHTSSNRLNCGTVSLRKSLKIKGSCMVVLCRTASRKTEARKNGPLSGD